MIWCRSSGIPLCSFLTFTFCSIHFLGLAKQVLIRFTKAILSQEANSPPPGFSEFSIVFPFLVHFPGVCTTKSTSVISEGWHSGVVQYFEALTALCCLFPAQIDLRFPLAFSFGGWAISSLEILLHRKWDEENESEGIHRGGRHLLWSGRFPSPTWITKVVKNLTWLNLCEKLKQ